MDVPKKESDIAPIILDEHSDKINIRKIECYDFLQCGACALIIFFSCFKP